MAWRPTRSATWPRRRPKAVITWPIGATATTPGIGPGAHGRVTLDGELIATRRHARAEPWAERVERHGHGSTEEERIGTRDRAREMLMMGLRLAEGIDLARFQARTGLPFAEAVDAGTMLMAVDAGYLAETPGRVAATLEGRLRLDALLAALVR